MRVAIVTESFLPATDGVSGSVQRVCEHLTSRGHQTLILAPGPGPTRYAGASVVRCPSVPLPRYPAVRVGTRLPAMHIVLANFSPDVVHLAGPLSLGAQGAFAARRLGIPAVAVFQTDIAGFAYRYGFGVASGALWQWLRAIHSRAALTLAPSQASVEQLQRHGVPRVLRWGRGVDGALFSPARRDPWLRQWLAPRGQLIVGYVGRLAHEKQIHLLRAVTGLPGVRVVVVGDGPLRRPLERMLPSAEFLGFLSGPALASAFASLDVFVHTGSHETFCQTAQEAQASGVAVVAPAAGGLLDLVEHGQTGLLYAPGDGRALADAVSSLRDSDFRRRLGAAGCSVARQRSWTAVGDELIGHYRRARDSAEVLALPATARRPVSPPGDLRAG